MSGPSFRACTAFTGRDETRFNPAGGVARRAIKWHIVSCSARRKHGKALGIFDRTLKPFDRRVRVFLGAGLAANPALVALLFTGVVKSPRFHALQADSTMGRLTVSAETTGDTGPGAVNLKP